jgi:hypothetical protein
MRAAVMLSEPSVSLRLGCHPKYRSPSSLAGIRVLRFAGRGYLQRNVLMIVEIARINNGQASRF